eukprot:1685935-Amphidinium_carterae.1
MAHPLQGVGAGCGPRSTRRAKRWRRTCRKPWQGQLDDSVKSGLDHSWLKCTHTHPKPHCKKQVEQKGHRPPP